MIKTIRINEHKGSKDKYEVKVGDCVRIHDRYRHLSGDLRAAIMHYSDDTIFEVVYASSAHFKLKVLNTNDYLEVTFIQRSGVSTSSYRFSQNYTLVEANICTLKDISLHVD